MGEQEWFARRITRVLSACTRLEARVFASALP
jgi:hypothetical protein